jgi:DNA-binding NarL/FixJ family response regulator
VSEQPAAVGQLRVVIADDHARIRGRVREALEQSDCVVVGEGATAADAVRLAQEHKPDVALLDIHMPGNGIHAAREISKTLPETTVVMLTQSAEDDDVFDSLRAGASGYLLKDTDPARLGDVLRAVLNGEGAMPRRLLARILEEFRAPAKRRFSRKSSAAAKLTEREWEVMEMLAEGLTTEEVAGRLFLSPTTVRVHVSSVLKKLRVRDRESAFEALREG